MDWSPTAEPGRGGDDGALLQLILCYSRRLWIGFSATERLPTLLYAHVEALRYHQGSPMRIVYDNQTTVTLGDGKDAALASAVPGVREVLRLQCLRGEGQAQGEEG